MPDGHSEQASQALAAAREALPTKRGTTSAELAQAHATIAVAEALLSIDARLQQLADADRG